MVPATEAFAQPAEADFRQFEGNAALWRLEASTHVTRLTEDRAVGVASWKSEEAARTTLEGVRFEIDRLQGFGRQHAPLGSDAVLRLAEIGLMLETARRLLDRALNQPEAPAVD